MGLLNKCWVMSWTQRRCCLVGPYLFIVNYIDIDILLYIILLIVSHIAIDLPYLYLLPLKLALDFRL